MHRVQARKKRGSRHRRAAGQWALLELAARQPAWFPGLFELCLAQDTTADARVLVRAGLQFFEQHPPPRPTARPRFESLLRLVANQPWHDDLDTLRRVVVLLEGGHLQWVDIGARARLLAHHLPNADFNALFDRDPVCVLTVAHDNRELRQRCRLASARRQAVHDVLNYFERTLRWALEWPGAGEPLVPCRRWPVLGANVSAGRCYVATGRWSIARLHWLALGLSTLATRQDRRGGVGLPSAAAAFAWSYAASRTHYAFAGCDVDTSAPLTLHYVPVRWPRVLGWDDAIVVANGDAWVLRWWLRAIGDVGRFDWQRNVGFRNGRVFFGLGLLASWDPRLDTGIGASGNVVLQKLHEFRYGHSRPFAKLCPRRILWDLDEATTTLTSEDLRQYSTFLVSRRSVDTHPHCVVWFANAGRWHYYNPDRPATLFEPGCLAETLNGCLSVRPQVQTEDAGGTPDQDGSERSCFLLSLARALMVAHSTTPGTCRTTDESATPGCYWYPLSGGACC
eukprot:g79548.t1